MNSNKFRMPARRLATIATATALAAGPAALAGAGSAHATGDHGHASAVVLRTGLDVSLLNKTVNVPLAVTLNEVKAPSSAEKTLLKATLDGVDRGRPFTMLRADVARASATTTAAKAEGSTELVHAKVHVPGLPLLSLIEVEQVTAKATCEAGKKPVAASNVLGTVTVLGKRVTLKAGGTTDVNVSGVGDVRLSLSKKETTSSKAAATALELTVNVNPLKLNVAEVQGTVTLVNATCESPAAPAGGTASAPDGSSAAPADAPADGTAGKAADGVEPQGGAAEDTNLAETGGNSATPYIAGGALALLVAGGGSVLVARRGRS
ncbi:SCO1860 family LAETG-anchored protein [Streptomyces sp. NPDC005925]|uniref:SCO1860 family LAETG-anchored protein n=1 Tax=Streptomyces sp. NPDC005925 TaxID=3157172 RepID=UPI0033DF38D1